MCRMRSSSSMRARAQMLQTLGHRPECKGMDTTLMWQGHLRGRGVSQAQMASSGSSHSSTACLWYKEVLQTDSSACGLRDSAQAQGM